MMADTAIQMLLKRLRGEGIPIPYAPIPDLGPLSTDTSAAFQSLNPEPVLPRFAQPAAPDMGFVNQYAGAAPTAPALSDPTTIDKLAAILGGIGYGPQYGMALREERERPQREFEAKQERYEERRTRGLELAERRAEREAERANRAAELAYERDYKTWLKKYDVRKGAAAQQAAQAFQLLRDARTTAENERKERVLLRRQIALQIDDRIKAYRDQGASLGGKDYAEELARNDFRMALEQLGEKVAPLSAAASKANTLVQAKIQRALRLAQGGGGGTGGGPVMAKLANGQLVPLSAVNKDIGGVMLGGNIVPVVEYVGGRIPRQPQQPQAQAAPTLNLFPEFSGGLLTGGGGKTIKMVDVRRQAKKAGISPTKAAQDFKDAGYTIEQ